MSSPAPSSRPLTLVGLFLTSVVALFLPGCGRQGFVRSTMPLPSAPDAARSADVGASAVEAGAARGWATYFPLEIGNRWHYTERIATKAVTNDGTELDWGEVRGTMDARLVGVRTINERDFVVEEQTFVEDATGLQASDNLYLRQDESGLYENTWDAAVTSRTWGPDARARMLLASIGSVRGADARAIPSEAFRHARESVERKLSLFAPRAGAAPSGIQSAPPPDQLRLAYPLHVGAQWTVSPDPPFSSQVEGLDVLNLASGHFPAWRVRFTSVLFGPNDWAYLWYGRDGYFAFAGHLEAQLVDLEGNHLGTMIVQFDERLDEIDLAGARDLP